MKREDINLFLESLKIVLSGDINKLFLKTEGGDESLKTRKYNKNLKIIEDAINKVDDETELFLICLKKNLLYFLIMCIMQYIFEKYPQNLTEMWITKWRTL